MSETESRTGPTALALRLLAEFAVIVLGVLVALGVEGWFSDRQDADREVELLQSLASDLRGSLAILEEDNSATLSRVGTLDWFLRVPVDSGEAVPIDSLPSVSNAANVTAAYYPTLRTYETMIATGTFDLITSEGVRRSLADVKYESQIYNDYRAQATQQWNDTFSVTWLEFMGVHPLDGEFGPMTVPGATSADAAGAALRDDFFRAVIDRRRIFLFFVAENGQRLADTMRATLDLITDELDVRGARAE